MNFWWVLTVEATLQSYDALRLFIILGKGWIRYYDVSVFENWDCWENSSCFIKFLYVLTTIWFFYVRSSCKEIESSITSHDQIMIYRAVLSFFQNLIQLKPSLQLVPKFITFAVQGLFHLGRLLHLGPIIIFVPSTMPPLFKKNLADIQISTYKLNN